MENPKKSKTTKKRGAPEASPSSTAANPNLETMNPKKSKTTKKRGALEASPSSTAENFLFRSDFHKERFNAMKSRKFVKERVFDLKGEEYPEIRQLLVRNKWIHLCSIIKSVESDVVREFYANAFVRKGEEKEREFTSWVRGKEVRYDSSRINEILKIHNSPTCSVVKARKCSKRDWPYDEMLSYLCRPGASWMKFSNLHHIPTKLEVKKLKPEAKAWTSFLHHTIETCSNGSELQTIRALAVMAIMKKQEVNIGKLIADDIFQIANNDSKALGHASLIVELCTKAGVKDVSGGENTSPSTPINCDWIHTSQVEGEKLDNLKGVVPRLQPQQQPGQMEQGEGSQHGTYPPVHPMILEYMFTSANWMNEISDQMWVNRPRFSTEFDLEAQMHRRPITGSYERFDSSRERMDEYFAHQEQYAAYMKKEITDDFNAGEKRADDDIFEGLPEAGDDEDVNMG